MNELKPEEVRLLRKPKEIPDFEKILKEYRGRQYTLSASSRKHVLRQIVGAVRLQRKYSATQPKYWFKNDEGLAPTPPYTARPIKEVSYGKGYWSHQIIGVFENGVQIGEYKRNYSSFFGTFYPFQKNGKWFALYSPSYVCTRVMSLPDCKELGGEPDEGYGFCPTGYFVPYLHYRAPYYWELSKDYTREEWDKWYNEAFVERYADFGFVCGCHWGDDSSWKIQHLNLDEADQGIIKRDARFGYIELPGDISGADLHRAINFRFHDPRCDETDPNSVCIKLEIQFDLTTGKPMYLDSTWKEAIED